MEVRGRGEDTKIGGTVINRLAGAASPGAAKGCGCHSKLDREEKDTRTVFIVEGKTQMFALHAYQENRCHMCMQLCEFADHVMVDY